MTKDSITLTPSFAPSRPGKGGRSLAYVSGRHMIPASWFHAGKTTPPGTLGMLSGHITITSVRGNLPPTSSLFAAVSLPSGGESEFPEPVHSSRRQRELRWLQTHREDLRKFAGQWIVLESEEIVAHGSDPAAVVREARSKGVRVPFVYRVEGSRPKGVVYIGL